MLEVFGAKGAVAAARSALRRGLPAAALAVALGALAPACSSSSPKTVSVYVMGDQVKAQVWSLRGTTLALANTGLITLAG